MGVKDHQIGVHHGRTDLERVGIFAEMGYLHGKGYTGPVANTDIRDVKNPQMHPGVPKWKTGLQDCYFDQKYKRIFEKEAYTTAYAMEVNAQKELKKKYPNLKTFIPASYPKKHATPGDYFGTFEGNIKAFSPSLKPQAATEKLPLNIKTNPGKKGGPGYADICINKYPAYKSSPFDDPKLLANDPKRKEGKYTPFLGGSFPSYFDKNPFRTSKIQATYKEEFSKKEKLFGPFLPSSHNKTVDGCFPKASAYRSSAVRPPKVDKSPPKGKDAFLSGPFRPQPRNKSMYTHSIMGRKVDVAVNSQNWRGFKPITYTRDFII